MTMPKLDFRGVPMQPPTVGAPRERGEAKSHFFEAWVPIWQESASPMHTWHIACRTGECEGVTVCSGLGTGPVPYYIAHHVVARHRQQLAPPVTISG